MYCTVKMQAHKDRVSALIVRVALSRLVSHLASTTACLAHSCCFSLPPHTVAQESAEAAPAAALGNI